MLVLCVVVIRLAPTGDKLSDKGRKWILALRLLALILLGITMLRPTLVYTETVKLPASLYLLVDQSESMSVKDEVGGKSRFDLAKQTLLDSEKVLQKFQKRFDVHPFRFDSTLHQLEMSRGAVSLPANPEGKETAIGFVLDEIYQRAAGKRLLATILLTDGTQRARSPRDMTPRDAAVKFRDSNFPIYTIPFGKPGVADNLDVAVKDLLAADHIFVKNELVVSGQIRINGYLNQQIPVRLMFETSPGKMEEVAKRNVSATEEGQLIPYRFSYIPLTTGLKKMSVEIPTLPKEVVKTNNEISSFVRVLDGGLNVLYLEGSRRREQWALRKSIDSSVNINLAYERLPVEEVVAKSKTTPDQSADSMLRRETSSRSSLLNQDYSGVKFTEFTVYMIGDLDSAALKEEELQAIADAVRNGAGLIMLGGNQSFGSGGYGQTPLGQVLPVEMRSAERHNLGDVNSPDLHWNMPMIIRPTDIAKNNPMLLLGNTPAESMKLWLSLSSLAGANRLRPKGSATVLLEGPDKQPVLLSQTFGNGRVLAFAGDTTWNWWFDNETEHKRFWRQIILWLAKMDESLQGDCWIELERPRYAVGETVKFKVLLRSEKGVEVRSPKVSATVRFPDMHEEQITMVDENGVATGSIRNTTKTGDYTIRATASSGTEMREATARFLMFDQDLELDNPVMDSTLLGSIATMTGGTSIPPESLSALLEELDKKSELLTERRETKLTLYDSWPMLITLVLVMCLEWFLRKLFGLV